MPKTAIVTGASRGIGKAVAKRLARDGCAVVVNYASNAKEADATVAEIQSAGGQAIAVMADVGIAEKPHHSVPQRTPSRTRIA
jgi:3-oxoacyl-[acyl-carrier protein] reductase